MPVLGEGAVDVALHELTGDVLADEVGAGGDAVKGYVAAVTGGRLSVAERDRDPGLGIVVAVLVIVIAGIAGRAFPLMDDDCAITLLGSGRTRQLRGNGHNSKHDGDGQTAKQPLQVNHLSSFHSLSLLCVQHGVYPCVLAEEGEHVQVCTCRRPETEGSDS